MKKFKFTLETVHNVREMKQENEQLVLTQLQNEAAKAAEQIEKIETAYLRAIESYSQKINSGRAMHIGEMELEALHLSALERQKRRAVEVLDERKRAVTEQRVKLAAASREVKVTDRLRETQALRHRIETDKHEQNAMDELVSANFAREMRTK
jgi:flagellar export protein FliJ